MLDLDKIPDGDEIKIILNKCRGISNDRKDKLLELYTGKVESLKELQ